MRNLFEEFPGVSKEQWDKAIEKLLKGKDYNDTLVWKTEEGFDIQPYYTYEDLPSSSYSTFNKTTNDWNIRERIVVSNDLEANKLALDALMKGATAVEFIIAQNIDFSVSNLLKNIETQYAPVYLILEEINNSIVEEFNSLYKNSLGGVYVDPIGDLTVGRFTNSVEDLYVELKDFLAKGGKLRINGVHLRDAGSNITMELAFVVSQIVEIIEKTSIDLNGLLNQTEFNLGIASNYFFEIAKLKSLNYLLSKVAEGYGVELTSKPEFSACSCISNKTIFDPYVNMLRGTTEAMSSAIAGYDNICILPYNIAYEVQTEFSSRIARNIQLILKEESYLNNVIDASSGSYYIEHLTNELNSNSWDLFLKVEDLGGFTSSLKQGHIQKTVTDFADSKVEKTESGENVLLGTNKYPNKEEDISDKVSKSSIHFPPIISDNLNAFEPLIRFRYAESLDEQRLSSE